MVRRSILGADFGAFSPLPIVRYHYGALRDPGAVRLSRSAKFLLFGLPIIAGVGVALAVASGMRLVDGISQVLAATALLIGAMLSAFVFLTNLRIKISESATYAFRANLQRLIGGAAVGCLYVAGVALFTAGLLVAVATIEFLRGDYFRPIMAGLLTAALLHLLVNLSSVTRRLFATYFDIFASDFTAEGPIAPTEPAAESRAKPGERTGPGH